MYLAELIHPAFQIFDGTVQLVFKFLSGDVQLDFKAINSAVQHLRVGMGVSFCNQVSLTALGDQDTDLDLFLFQTRYLKLLGDGECAKVVLIATS